MDSRRHKSGWEELHSRGQNFLENDGPIVVSRHLSNTNKANDYKLKLNHYIYSIVHKITTAKVVNIIQRSWSLEVYSIEKVVKKRQFSAKKPGTVHMNFFSSPKGKI